MQSTTQLDIKPTPQKTIDQAIATLGILDQAVRGLIQIRQQPMDAGPPRSPLLEIYHVYHRFSRSPSLLSQLSLLSTAGGTGARIVKEWQGVLRVGPEFTELKDERRPARLYMIASLAVASLVVPWLLLRKR